MIQRPQFCSQCGGELQVRETDGSPRPVCVRCGHVVYLNPAPSIAAILVRDGRVLLVKRNIEPGRGLWSLPGGFIEEDETVEQAVIREVREETGLSCLPRRLCDAHAMRSAVYGSILVLCFEADIDGGELKAGGDAEETRFFPRDQLPEIAFDIHRTFLEKYGKRSFSGQDRVHAPTP
jgi:8-oxo-dGTP diphosphatase